MATAEVDLVDPQNKATGIPLKQTITVIFSKEMDENTITSGTLFAEGPDDTIVAGSDLSIIKAGSTQALKSPGYKGILEGSYEFSRVDLVTTAEVTTLDTVADGELYRTKVVFTPKFPLGPGIQYDVFVLSDENAADTLLSGISDRTVFDTVEITNTGTGSANFLGGFTGIPGVFTDVTYTLSITSSGEPGTAIAEWSRSADAVTGVVTVSTQRTLVANGLFVQFLDGTYEVGDEWTVIVRPPSFMEGNFTFNFTTGSGSIQEIPTTSSSSILSLPTVASSSTTPFRVINITPEHRATNLAPELISNIVVEFNKDIDPVSVTQETVKVISEAVNGDPEIQVPTTLAVTHSITGKILTISFI